VQAYDERVAGLRLHVGGLYQYLFFDECVCAAEAGQLGLCPAFFDDLHGVGAAGCLPADEDDLAVVAHSQHGQHAEVAQPHHLPLHNKITTVRIDGQAIAYYSSEAARQAGRQEDRQGYSLNMLADHWSSRLRMVYRIWRKSEGRSACTQCPASGTPWKFSFFICG
jgi:hypothetical protein